MTSEIFYPPIDVAGAPFEMGYSHGRQLQPRIRKSIAGLRTVVGAEAYETSWDDLQHTCAYCERMAPDLVQEMRGIAEGAGVDFRDVFKINAHLELVVWKRLVFNERLQAPASACSSHAVATDAEILLGWNGDDWKGWLDCAAVVRGHPTDGDPFLYWSWAGTVGRPGLGSHLALGANTLPSKRWRADGLLYNLMSRRLLTSRTAEEAVGQFKTYTCCSGMNYLIADEAGHLINVESHPDGYAQLYPQDLGPENYILHTNCYLDTELVAGEAPEVTCSRLAAARRLYKAHQPTDVAGVRAVQSDHTGSVCQHFEDHGTIVSFVAEVRNKRIHVVRGNPCVGSPQTLTLN